jgi:predicted SAM-dependent methyltransferase
MTTEVAPLLKLDLGSSALRVAPDYTTVDLYAPEADVKADLGSLPFDTDSVDEIWASHCLEHVEWERTADVLAEWLRVLKPGAPAIIAVPNVDYAARYWLHGPNRADAHQMLFGSPSEPGGLHQGGWSPKSMRDDLEAAGFTVLRVDIIWETPETAVGSYTHDMETIRAEVIKPEVTEWNH